MSTHPHLSVPMFRVRVTGSHFIYHLSWQRKNGGRSRRLTRKWYDKSARSAGALVFSLTGCRRTCPGSHKSMQRCRCLLIKITVVLSRATAGLVAMVLGGKTPGRPAPPCHTSRGNFCGNNQHKGRHRASCEHTCPTWARCGRRRGGGTRAITTNVEPS